MSKELEYEVNNFANLLHKDCMNLMECLKKQSEDNKPILYLGKHYEKVILPYKEYQKMCKRLESIDNANPSEALECLEALEQDIKDRVILAEDRQLKLCAVIKQALLKAQKPKQYVDELKLVEKKLQALEIIKEKDCDVSWLKYCIKENLIVEAYNSGYPEYHKKLTEEEFNLLKEWLE